MANGPLAGGLPNSPASDSDNLSPLQWDMAQIHTPEAHAITGGSSSVLVGDIDSGMDVEVAGTLVLNAFDAVLVKGSFRLQLGTVTDTKGTTVTTDDITYQEMVLTLGEGAFNTATPVQVFIGVGGVLDDSNTPMNFSDDVINLDSGVGFYGSLNLSLITLKNNNKTPTV